MRRPINNGVPIQLALGDKATIFNANDFDPSYVYLVTLDAWVPAGEASTLALSVETGGPPPLMTTANLFSSDPGFTNDALNLLRRNVVGPTRIMERFACRGNQLISATALKVGGAPITIWGHFERAGISPIPAPMRPLQPTNNLQPPFDAPVTQFIVAPGATQKVTLHLFDTKEERLDYVWLSLYAAFAAAEAALFGETAVLKLAGLNINLSIQALIPPAGYPPFWKAPSIDFFDGLPLKAQGSYDKLEVEVTVPIAGSAVTFYADGRFFRS